MTPDSLLLIIGPALAALGAYLAAVRRFSGKIQSSDATELWAESRAIREGMDARILALEGRVTLLETRNNELVRENDELRRTNALLEAKCDRLIDANDLLRRQLHRGSSTRSRRDDA